MNPVRASLRYPAGNYRAHRHVGRLRRLCSAAHAAPRGSEDPRARGNRGGFLSRRLRRGGRESGHAESRAAALQNRGRAPGKDLLHQHERSHVHQSQPGRQPSGHGEVLVQATSRHGGVEEDGPPRRRGRPRGGLRFRRHGRGAAGDSRRPLRVPRTERLCRADRVGNPPYSGCLQGQAHRRAEGGDRRFELPRPAVAIRRNPGSGHEGAARPEHGALRRRSANRSRKTSDPGDRSI